MKIDGITVNLAANRQSIIMFQEFSFVVLNCFVSANFIKENTALVSIKKNQIIKKMEQNPWPMLIFTH